MYRLFVLMMESFNFKVNLRLAHLWGMKDTDGNWQGAVGALNRSHVDFCVTGLRWASTFNDSKFTWKLIQIQEYFKL